MLLQMMDTFAEHLDTKTINGAMLDNICTGFSDTVPIMRELTVKSMLHIASRLSSHNLNTRIMRHFTKLQVFIILYLKVILNEF